MCRLLSNCAHWIQKLCFVIQNTVNKIFNYLIVWRKTDKFIKTFSETVKVLNPQSVSGEEYVKTAKMSFTKEKDC